MSAKRASGISRANATFAARGHICAAVAAAIVARTASSRPETLNVSLSVGARQARLGYRYIRHGKRCTESKDDDAERYRRAAAITGRPRVIEKIPTDQKPVCRASR